MQCYSAWQKALLARWRDAKSSHCYMQIQSLSGKERSTCEEQSVTRLNMECQMPSIDMQDKQGACVKTCQDDSLGLLMVKQV